MIVLMNSGGRKILENYVKSQSFTVHLDVWDGAYDFNCANNDLSDFQIPVGGGYEGAKTLTPGNWTVGPTSDPPEATYAGNLVWTFTGAIDNGELIYGYFVLDADGVLIWAEEILEDGIETNNGSTVTIQVKLQMGAGTPA